MAWWLWALGLAAAASRTTNPLLLGLIVAVAAYVVAARRPDAPWARAFRFFLILAALVVVSRVVLGVLLGAPQGDVVVVTLPELGLPTWAAGLRLGGDVTLGAVLFAFYDGLRLATILICVGAANSLASPTRLLRSLPAALYEAGVAVAVSLSVVPQLVEDAGRVADARRLRGRADRGPRALAAAALPVLEGGLDRAVGLAAAMDSRGYGRTRTDVSPAENRLIAGLLVGGLIGVLVGTYGLLDADAPGWSGVPLLAVGALAAALGLGLAGRRSVRTRYRPDPWDPPEWATAGSGLVTALVLIAAAAVGGDALADTLAPSVDPAAWPALPLLPALAVLAAAAPAHVTPTPPDRITVARREVHA